MPTSVSELFENFDIKLTGKVPWGISIPSTKNGIYVVSVSNNPNQIISTFNPKFSQKKINQWIDLINSKNKTLSIDGKPGTCESIEKRLAQFWLNDETIIYIGKAGPSKHRTLKKRVKEFYDYNLGCNKRHAGGLWLHSLENIEMLWVHYAELAEIEIEEDLINYFSEKVSENSKRNLFDSEHCFPFANKEINKTCRKKHGFGNQTVDCGKITNAK